MTHTGSRRGLPAGEPSTWLVRLLSLGFMVLGLVFVFAPRAGASLFGLPAPEFESSGYLPAIGLRDLAFGLYLLILSLTSTQRVLGLIFAATLVIPIGDLVIVASARGPDAISNLMLHGVSAAVMAGASLWLLRTASHDKQGGQQ